jgi:hypothetical protein
MVRAESTEYETAASQPLGLLMTWSGKNWTAATAPTAAQWVWLDRLGRPAASVIGGIAVMCTARAWWTMGPETGTDQRSR